MPKKAKNEDDFERLAKGVSKDKKRARPGRTRKNSLCAQPGGDARGALANKRDVSPLVRLVGALRDENIRFQLIGMSAAVLQGVPVVTNDIDLWIDLPARQYMTPVNTALRLGATMVRNTVVELSDGMLVNFIYEVTGLGSFATEFRKARILSFYGETIPVMPLELIRKSKMAVMRPKDEAHISYINQTLQVRGEEKKRK